MKREVTQLNNRLSNIKDRVSTSKVSYCEVCNITWVDTIHNDCPSCNSGDSPEIGWIQTFEDMEPTSEPESSKLAPAEGGVARRATTQQETHNKKGNEKE